MLFFYIKGSESHGDVTSLFFLQLYLLPYRLAARYPKTRIGRLATYTDHSRKLDLCDDYIVHSNEFFFDRDPRIFHNIFNFYRCATEHKELC